MKPNHEIITIDCVPHHPGRVAAYLIRHGNRAAFVDNHTGRAIPYLLAALEQAHLAPEQVEFIIVTHVHLDHSSGTNSLLSVCPNATVLAHPRAVRHLVNPDRLTTSARAVYGEDIFNRVYGEVPPVPIERIRAVDDAEFMVLGDEPLEFLHTEGHARHHICIHDPAQKAVFTGDTFGAGRQLPGGIPLVLCSCPPTDFDPGSAYDTYKRVQATGATGAWITHYGKLDITPALMEQLAVSTRAMEEIGRAAFSANLDGTELVNFCEAGINAAFEHQILSLGLTDVKSYLPWAEGDLRMNARGIAHWVERVLRRNRG
jgi:glyoxylase-like metal-dependent hydrolase (beta-lactamase superfamily II)